MQVSDDRFQAVRTEQNKIGIISASGWLFKNKSITIHGNMNVKFILCAYICSGPCHSGQSQ